MLIVISPAKTLNMEAEAPSDFHTTPKYLEKSQQLINTLKKKSIKKLEDLMGISTQLAQLNYERFQQWQYPYQPEEAKQAIFAFRGDVYTGLDIDTFSIDQLNYAQDHLRILSGLYGVLKPMDLILPYRLEMGTHLSIGRMKNLYEFWGQLITVDIKTALVSQNDDILINLASNEYYKSIDKKKLNAQIITPVFKDFKNGQYKMISFFAKKARGMMSRFILQNKLTKIEDLKHFEEDGYFFNDKLSTETSPTFTRG
jgi:cytoplasmic iron level regulating protein YaaA (DUF328/UPF0246 family)